MDISVVYTSVAIILGMLIQVALSLGRLERKDLRGLGPALVCSVALGLIPVKGETTYSLTRHAMFACAFFVLIIALVFRDRLLPRVQEGRVLIWNCIFVYAAISVFGVDHPIAIAAALVTFVMTVILVLPLPMSFAEKFVIYVWFLFLVTATAALQFRFADFGLVPGRAAGKPDYVSSILGGMAFAYLGIHATYLFSLIPISSRNHQSFGDRMKQLHSEASAMVARFSDKRLDPILAIAVVASLGAVMYWNLVSRTVAPWLLINVALVCTPIFGDALVALVRRFREVTLKGVAGK
jgi:hypothetical protein